MSSLKTKVIAASVVCAAAVIGVAAKYGGSSPPSAAAPSKEKAGSSGESRGSLEDRIAALERGREQACSGAAEGAASPPAASARAQAEDKDDNNGDGRGAKASPKSREQWKREVVEHYSSFHAGERVDPSWSGDAARSMAATFGKASFDGSSLASTDCRSTMCKLEIEHDSPAAQLYFMQHIPADPPFDTAGFYHRVEAGDGTFKTVLYVARDGHPLPAPTL